MRALIPFVFTILFFCGLFELTQIIDSEVWYMGNGQSSGAVIYNHKTEIQKAIFVFILSIWLTVLSFYRSHSRGLIIIINCLTIGIIYSANFLLSNLIESGGFNIYNHWRINLGVPLAIKTMILTSALVLISHLAAKKVFR